MASHVPICLQISNYNIEDTIWPVKCQYVFKYLATKLKIQYGQPCANMFKYLATKLKIQYGQPCANMSSNI